MGLSADSLRDRANNALDRLAVALDRAARLRWIPLAMAAIAATLGIVMVVVVLTVAEGGPVWFVSCLVAVATVVPLFGWWHLRGARRESGELVARLRDLLDDPKAIASDAWERLCSAADGLVGNGKLSSLRSLARVLRSATQLLDENGGGSGSIVVRLVLATQATLWSLIVVPALLFVATVAVVIAVVA